MTTLFSVALGIASTNKDDEILEVFYPKPLVDVAAKDVTALLKAAGYDKSNCTTRLSHDVVVNLPGFGLDGVRELPFPRHAFIATALVHDTPPANVAEAFLKLHLLSHRLRKPNSMNLDGLFKCLHNLAWTEEGAIDLAELPERQLAARNRGRPLRVHAIDKFPPLVDYVVPKGVRIADTARVRLGAYLGEGTTIMHEGFVNFNAGCEGPNMIEGRISAGIMVGRGSDLGGGCSTMGTLSGGNQTIVSIGDNCLIGANAGVAIPLGDRCTVEAGLYLTAGSKVRLIDKSGEGAGVCKARDLAGKSDLLFRRNSLDGAIECLSNKTVIELNEELHLHN